MNRYYEELWMSEHSPPHYEPESEPERGLCVWIGWLVGIITGGGLSGFAWMNPYVALSLALGGTVLYITALLAIERSAPVHREEER